MIRRLTGIACLLIVGFGALYSSAGGIAKLVSFVQKTSAQEFTDLLALHNLPDFFPIFYGLAAICMIVFLIQAFCGLTLLLTSTRYIWLVTGLSLFLIFVPFFLKQIPATGAHEYSVGTAKAFVGASIAVGYLILYPFWSIPLVWLGKKCMVRE